MPLRAAVARQDRVERLAGRVVEPVSERHGVLQHRRAASRAAPSPASRADSSTLSTSTVSTASTRRFPRRGKAYVSSVAVHSVFQIAPRGPLYLDIGAGRLLECRHGGSPLVRKRIAALAGQPAVGERRFAGFRERGQRESPEPEFAAASMDEDALDPLLGPARLNQQIEAVSVAVAARLRDGAREGRRELVMRAFGLLSPRALRLTVSR